MNPYLEQPDAWQDFHQSFMKEIRDRLVAMVSGAYIVKLESHIYVHELSSEERRLVGKADIGLSGSGRPKGGGMGTDMLEAPLLVQLPVVDVERSSYVEIRDKSNRTLVTVIELISPTNKYSGPDREAFLAKRKNLMNGQVNYVEIDLLRGGPRLPIPELPACDYYVLVRRTIDWPVAGLWPFNLRDPLPRIPIPLQAPDGDLHLDLQQPFQAVFDAAGYEYHIYNEEPQPLLSAEDKEWARQLLKNELPQA
jgi:hypothetical protein